MYKQHSKRHGTLVHVGAFPQSSAGGALQVIHAPTVITDRTFCNLYTDKWQLSCDCSWTVPPLLSVYPISLKTSLNSYSVYYWIYTFFFFFFKRPDRARQMKSKKDLSSSGSLPNAHNLPDRGRTQGRSSITWAITAGSPDLGWWEGRASSCSPVSSQFCKAGCCSAAGEATTWDAHTLTEAPAQVLATRLPMQLPGKVPRKQQVTAQGLESLPSMWETSLEFLALGFSPAQPLLLQPSGK